MLKLQDCCKNTELIGVLQNQMNLLLSGLGIRASSLENEETVKKDVIDNLQGHFLTKDQLDEKITTIITPIIGKLQGNFI